MQCYKLTVSYDGTRYCGWQVQKEQKSIHQVLVDSFNQVFKQSVSLWGASRTDAGAHALGQVVAIRTSVILGPKEMCSAWNNALPNDIVVRTLEETGSLFNPYVNVEKKVYYYHVFTSRPIPFMEKYGWFVSRAINIEKLKKCLAVFIGTHDFRSFVMAKDVRANSIRTIYSATVERLVQFDCYRIAITGNAFLRYMVRRIVGACVGIASNNDKAVSDLAEALAKKDPKQHFVTAPAKGLLLYKIHYHKA